MGKKISELPAAATLDGTELLELVQAGANVKGALGALLPPGYLDGLKLQWISANALTVSSGAAYVPSLGRVLRVPNAIAKTGLALTTSSWYHVYLLLNGTNPDIEIVTTAPAAPYVGTARTKTSDTSRRYLGSVLTDANGAMWPFYHAPQAGKVAYAGPGNSTAFRVLSNKQTRAESVVNCLGVIPVTANYVTVRVLFNRTVGDNAFSIGPASGQYWNNVGAQNCGFIDMPCPTGSLYAALNNDITDGNGGGYIDVEGYMFER
jgi:hypothetical protein